MSKRKYNDGDDDIPKNETTLTHVMLGLDHKDLLNMCTASKSANAVCKHPFIWMQRFRTEYPIKFRIVERIVNKYRSVPPLQCQLVMCAANFRSAKAYNAWLAKEIAAKGVSKVLSDGTAAHKHARECHATGQYCTTDASLAIIYRSLYFHEFQYEQEVHRQVEIQKLNSMPADFWLDLVLSYFDNNKQYAKNYLTMLHSLRLMTQSSRRDDRDFAYSILWSRRLSNVPAVAVLDDDNANALREMYTYFNSMRLWLPFSTQGEIDHPTSVERKEYHTTLTINYPYASALVRPRVPGVLLPQFTAADLVNRGKVFAKLTNVIVVRREYLGTFNILFGPDSLREALRGLSDVSAWKERALLPRRVVSTVGKTIREISHL